MAGKKKYKGRQIQVKGQISKESNEHAIDEALLNTNGSNDSEIEVMELGDSHENTLKCGEWKQDAHSVDVTLLIGKRLKQNDIDVHCSESDARVQTTDGRRWYCRFFRSIDPTETKIIIKGMKLLLKIKKKVKNQHWLDLWFLPGQSDKPQTLSPKKTVLPVQQVHSDIVLGSMDLNKSPDGVQSLNIPWTSSSSYELISDASLNSEQVIDEQVEELVTPGAQRLQEALQVNGCSQVKVTRKNSCQDLSFKVDSQNEDLAVYTLSHVNHDFSEKTMTQPFDCGVIYLCVRDIIKNSVSIQIVNRSVTTRFKTRDKKFLSLHHGTSDETLFSWEVTVVGDLDVSKCKHKLNSYNLEVHLIKKEPGRWSRLEAAHSRENFQASSTAPWPAVPLTAPWPAVPSASSTSPPTPSPSPSNSRVYTTRDEEPGPNVSRESSFEEVSSTSTYQFQNKLNEKPMAKVQPFHFSPDQLTEDGPVRVGYTGLDNIGNTCFMNSILQVLANCTELRDYFLSGAFQKEINYDNPLGTGGKLAIEFATLVRVLWSGKKESYAPSGLKKLIAQRKSMFSGYAQHDAQEYMSFLLDGLHEDLNRIKSKPYVQQSDASNQPDEVIADEAWKNHKKRNDSYLVDLFQGQYKSTLLCPECNKVSVTFDPFMHLVLPLPKKQKLLPLMFIFLDPQSRPKYYVLRIGRDALIQEMKHQLHQLTDVRADCMYVYEVYKNKILQTFNNRQSVANISPSDCIVVQEVLSMEENEETVMHIPVLQRTYRPLIQPDNCSYCKEFHSPENLKKCTGCYRVGYCDSDCQRSDWSLHRHSCSDYQDLVGMPFIISIPASQATFQNIASLAQAFARFSVDVFQPPQSEASDSSPPTPCTPDSAYLSCDGTFLSPTSVTTNIELSTDSQQDSEGGACEAVVCSEKDEEPCCSGLAVKSAWSQGTDSSSGADSSNSQAEITGCSSASLTEANENRTTTKNSDSVEGARLSQQTSTWPFYLLPCDHDGQNIVKRPRYKDQGNQLLDLDGIGYIGMDWKNSPKLRPCVNVQTREYKTGDCENDPDNVNRIAAENQNSSIQECLELFTEPEVLSADEAWFCPWCKKHQEATKQMSLWRLPPVLVIQLKRFSYRNFLWCDKVDKMVEFPVNDFDLSAFCQCPLASSMTYDLFGVVNHYGGILGGHYTSFTRTPRTNNSVESDIGWRLCDDSRVSQCSRSDVVTSSAYLLFYRRRNSAIPCPPDANLPLLTAEIVSDLEEVEEQDIDISPVNSEGAGDSSSDSELLASQNNGNNLGAGDMSVPVDTVDAPFGGDLPMNTHMDTLD